MVDRRGKIRVGDRDTLGIRDGGQWHLRECDIKLLQISEILPSVQRGERAVRVPRQHRQVEPVKMDVNDIELRSHPADFVEHDRVIGNNVLYGGIRSWGLAAAGN